MSQYYAGHEVFDEDGELVCTKPFPSMPTHFWNDEDGIKYTKAYFSKFQGLPSLTHMSRKLAILLC